MIIIGHLLSYLAWWISTVHCEHPLTRGVYGDEIIYAANGRRWQCLRCGRYLKSRPIR